jgi:hypothetical protein
LQLFREKLRRQFPEFSESERFTMTPGRRSVVVPEAILFNLP